MKHFFSGKPQFVIFLCAAVCTVVVGLTSFFIMEIYRTVQPIWVEQAAYGQWPMVLFLQSLRQEGFLPAVLQWLGTRHLLQIWILGLLMPSVLGWFHAPLVVVLPPLAIFLGLFGWAVYKRTHHLGYAAATMLLYFALSELTRHNWGIGSGFADWQSMLLLSAAVLCLVNALTKPGLAWIRMFAVLVTLTILARTTAAFHAFVMCGPILLIYVIAQYKKNHSFRQLGVIFLNIFVIVLPAALIVMGQLPRMLKYYDPSHAWNLRQPLTISASNIFSTLLVPFMGIPLIVFCFILFIFNIFQPVLSKHRFLAQSVKISYPLDWTELAVAWWVLGFFCYLLANGYTSDVPKEVMYAVPPILFISVSPFVLHNLRPAVELKWLALVITAFSLVSFGWYAYQNSQKAGRVTPEQAAWRYTQIEMASALSKLPEGTYWQSYTPADWGIPVSLLTLYEYGGFRRSPDGFFYNRKEYWNTWNPGLSLPELQEKLYTRTLDCIDVAVVLKDPDQKPPQMEDYSYELAAFIARSVQSDTRWRIVGEVNALPFDTKFALYVNTAATHSDECQK